MLPTRRSRHNGVVHNDTTFITIDLSREDHQEYYRGFANRVLWPIFHYRIDLAEFSRRDLSGYLRVNDNFARQLDKVLGPDDLVWVHDYHLLPLAKALRERGHKNRIGFFLHIPCPPPEMLTALPHHERLIPCGAALLFSLRLAGCSASGSASPSFGGSERLLRGGTHRVHHSVLVVGADRA